MSNKLCVHLYTVLLLVYHVQAAKILGIFPIASVSHQLVFQPIWRELSLRGHQVTVLTPNPLRDSSLINLTEIDLSFQYENLEPMKESVSKGMNHWQFMEPIIEIMTPSFIDREEILSVVNDNTSKYDIVLGETMSPITYGFAAKFNCPLIGVASLNVLTITHESVGNPTHPVLNPDFLTPYYRGELTFFQKVDTVLFNLYEKYIFHYRFLPQLNRVLKMYFGETIPNIQDIERNMSLLMINTNPVIHGPQLYGPNVIEFGGGIHLKPKKPLPSELKAFLDNAQEGVIYFSLGSNIKSKYLPEDKRKVLLNTFAHLPYKVLWKFEEDHLEDKPKNIKVEKWLPQQDVLGHPNIKLFITQGGLQSVEEGLLNAVPLLVLPFMADQNVNSITVQKLGVGLHLDFNTLSEETFLSTILRIVNDTGYKEKAVEIRRLLKDQPMTSLEKVVWWTEYVIRNKGATYLRNPRADVSWSEFLILDVVAFLFFSLITALFAFYQILRFVVKLVLSKNVTKRKSKVH